MVSEIRVSVLCLAYNHAKYIRNTLEGFVSQKTNFAYEIIIHDDASTDDTASIIKEYVAKYPELIRPIFQTVNQYSQRVSIWKEHMNHMIRGKYVALCEGDDYWTDPHKLQKQFEILEKHQECSMCVHRVQKIQEDGTITSGFLPQIQLNECAIDTTEFLCIRRNCFFHLSSFFMRTSLWLELTNSPPAFRQAVKVLDKPLLLYMAAQGKIYYLPLNMSAYRLFSIGSWSSHNKEKNLKNPDSERQSYQRNYEMMRLYDEYTEHQYDCKLGVYRGDFLWYSQNYLELLKKENKEYFRNFSIKKKLYTCLCAAFPLLGKIRLIARRLRQKRGKNE